jgi:general secretion pathway protein I
MTRQRGFTLVEVVVAFALLSLVLVTVFEIFTAGLARASELDHYARALAIAQSELASAGVEEALAEGEIRGESSDRQYRWTVTTLKHIEEADPAKPAAVVPYTLFRVQARVGWTAGNGSERDVVLSTLLITQTR